MTLPRARETKSGWTLDPELINEVSKEIYDAGWDSCMEAVEIAMLAAERIIKDKEGE